MWELHNEEDVLFQQEKTWMKNLIIILVFDRRR